MTLSTFPSRSAGLPLTLTSRVPSPTLQHRVQAWGPQTSNSLGPPTTPGGRGGHRPHFRDEATEAQKDEWLHSWAVPNPKSGFLSLPQIKD